MTATPRGGVRPVHVVALAVAGVLLLGSLVFVLAATSDRNDAADRRQQTTQAVRDQRLATADAKDQLTAARSARQATLDQIGAIIGDVRALADISDQSVDAARTTQAIGAADTPSVGDYNAAIARGNDLADRYNAATQTIRDRIKSIVRNLGNQAA